MEKTLIQAIDVWQDHLSNYVTQLNHLAPRFALGDFYSYIYNCQTSSMEYVHPGTHRVLGIAPMNFSVYRLARMMSPDELAMIRAKESVVRSFIFDYLGREEVGDYKIEYSFKITDHANRHRTMLNQATPISFDENMQPLHLMVVHTEISHLGIISNDSLSLLNMKNGPSYFNVSIEDGNFYPESKNNNKPNLSELLTNREIEIAGLLAKGLNAQEISERLCVSFNTVRTHRKNMLQKSGCNNATALVAQCINQGLI